MRRASLFLLVVMLIVPLSYLPSHSSEASLSLVPFTPSEVRVLVVSPANVYASGGQYLISDLASYGFNVTQEMSDSSAVDYRYDSKTSNLSQYDVVVLDGGYLTYPPVRVSLEEVDHFVNYGGVIIVVGDALFGNESNPTWPYFWGNGLFTSSPIKKLEQRLGVDFIDYLKDTTSQNDGTFTKTDPNFNGPTSLSYVTTPVQVNYQFVLGLNGAAQLYSFTTANNGKVTSGVTYFRNSTGATGIYVQGSYVYGLQGIDPYQIQYLGLTDIAAREKLLGSLIAYALEKDIATIIKPQPFAAVRLNWLGGRGWSDSYLNTTLMNFDSLTETYGITPTISFTDFLNKYYWPITAPKTLVNLKGLYRDWEYSFSLRNLNVSAMTLDQVQSLIGGAKANYTSLGMDLFSTVSTFAGYWNQTTLAAMTGENLYLLDMSGEPENLIKYYPDWWNLRVESGVIVHSGVQMGWFGEPENFTQINANPDLAKRILSYEYFKDRDKWALSVVKGFPDFSYSVPNFRRNEVGVYSLQTVYSNLTSEIPDIRFVPLVEAAMYFGNKWVNIANPVRAGSVVEFDVDSSAVPDVATIGKGMFWLSITANETIKAVLVDDKPWFYFDDHAITIPADTRHVIVTLGKRSDPTVLRTTRKVIDTNWDGSTFSVSASAMQGLNVTIQLSIPLLDVACSELDGQWGYEFDAAKRILKLWAISDVDGLVTFRVGADVSPPVLWTFDLSPTWYNSTVKVTANMTDAGTGIQRVILSYSVGSGWINMSMPNQAGFYVGVIPQFQYGTVVQFWLNACDNVGNWRVTDVSSYRVTDDSPPEIGVPQWSPSSPYADQPVFVAVSVIEPVNSSGVKGATLLYYLNGDFALTLKWINMTYANGMWQGTIPNQKERTAVTFFVVATDAAGNVVIMSERYTYAVSAKPLLDMPYIFLIGGAVGIVAIVSAVYLVKFRKREPKKHEPVA